MSNKKRFTVGANLSLKQDKPPSPPQKEKKKFLLAKYINVGYYLLAPLVAGVFFGLIADRFLKTKTLFTTVFIIVGTVGTFYNLYKLTKE